MDTPVDRYQVRWSDGAAGGDARFHCPVGISGILEDKALIDIDTHLPGRHHLEQPVSGNFKLLYLASHGIDLVIALQPQ